VENNEQKKWLESSGCDQMQGQHFFAAQPIDKIFEVLEKNPATL